VSGGTGYVTGDTVSLNGSSTPAQATVTASNGAITALTVTTPGSGYVAAPSGVTKVTGSGSGTITLTISGTKYAVGGITIFTPGYGYTTAPTLTVSTPNSGGTRATATVTSTVNALLFSNGGAGYTSAPSVTFTGGTTSDASATGGFASINLTANSNIGGDGNLVIDPVISSSGAFGFNKVGSGTLTLNNANTLSGSVSVNAGTLLVNGQTPGNSGTGTGPVAVNSGGTLGGNGVAAGTVEVKGSGNASPGGVITGGNSTTNGNLTTGALTWVGGTDVNGTGGGSYAWKLNINNAGVSGSPNFDKSGTNWDQLTISSLTVSASPSGTFNIAVIGLNGAAGASFDPTKDYAWVAANLPSSSSLNGFDPALFHIDTSGLTVPGLAGAFSINTSTNLGLVDPSGMTDLIISYSAAPEPTSLLLTGLAAGGIFLRRRRRAPAARAD
jgi:autotransporter-associated beta strand protein